MSHEVETMAYAHAVPWHGLGVPVSPDLTPAEMGRAAGLDWTVSKRPLFTPSTMVGVAQAAEGDLPSMMTPVPSRYALVRDTDSRVFDVVGKNWNPVQNSEVLDFFRRFCAEGGATMETAGALLGGEIVWALANLGDGFTLPGGDAVKGYLLLASRHRSGFCTVARVTPVRVVCANTLALSGGFGKAGRSEVRVPHFREFKAEEAVSAIGIAHEGMTEFGRNARLLQSLNISRDDAVRILAGVYQPQDDPKEVLADFDARASRTVKAMMDAALTSAGAMHHTAPGMMSTGWGLLNGATYYANHRARGSADARFASTTLGMNNDGLNKLYGRLVEMAD